MERVSAKEFTRTFKNYGDWKYIVSTMGERSVNVEISGEKLRAWSDKMVKFEGEWIMDRLKFLRRGDTLIAKLNDITWLQGDKYDG